MGFQMGNPFSNQAISLVQNQQEMQRRSAAAHSRKVTLLPQEDDSFRRAQLAATVKADNEDRALKRELALIQQNIANASNEEDRRRWELEFDQKKEILGHKNAEFEFEKEYKGKALGVDERRVGAAEKANELRERSEFGAGDAANPGLGSKAASRAAGAQGTAAAIEERKARTQEVLARLEGTLPNQIDQKRRTDILAQHQAMLERVQFARNEKDMYRLAIDAVKASRDPVTGVLDVEGGQAAMSRMMGSLFQEAQERGPQFAEAFMAGFNEESFRGSAEEAVNNEQAALRTGQNNAANKPYVPGAQRPGSLGDTLNAMEEIRRRARQQAVGAPPPSNVGR